MNAPHLRMLSGLTAARREVRPKAGRMVMFPAWLLHQFVSIMERRRISIAFNLAV